MMVMGRSALPVLSFHPSTLAVFRRLVLRTTMKSFACFFACNHKYQGSLTGNIMHTPRFSSIALYA